MTLNDIITDALVQLERGSGDKSVELWRRKFTRFVNDAIIDLTSFFKPSRCEKARIKGSIVDCNDLERPCLKVLNVTQDGFPLKFERQEASNIICVRGTGLVYVTYVYAPHYIDSLTAEPDLPEHFHGLIVSYVVARERMSGDKSTQSSANLYLQMYENAKSRLMTAMTDSRDLKMHIDW